MKFSTVYENEKIDLEKRDYFIPLGDDQDLLYEEFEIVCESTPEGITKEWQRRFVVRFENGINHKSDPFEVFFNWPHS